MFTYAARTAGPAYDGDTLTLDIDLGFGLHHTQGQFRLAWVNAPEVKGPSRPAGLNARDHVRRFTTGELRVRTIQAHEKYGRYLAEVFYRFNANWVNLNQELVTLGLAEIATYGMIFPGWTAPADLGLRGNELR